MTGRTGPYLLVVFVSILTPLASLAQTNQGHAGIKFTPDFSSDSWRVLPRDPQPPSPNPVPVVPRYRVSPPGAVGFPAIASAAGMIFSGTVEKVEKRPSGSVQSVETLAITFRVDNAIRGATPGEDLTILQWSGLWAAGQRYRVDEHVFLFLYPPGKLGLTSCVAGPLGRFQIDAWGRILLSAHQLSAFRNDPVLGGKSHAGFRDFALAVRRAGEEE